MQLFLFIFSDSKFSKYPFIKSFVFVITMKKFIIFDLIILFFRKDV